MQEGRPCSAASACLVTCILIADRVIGLHLDSDSVDASPGKGWAMSDQVLEPSAFSVPHRDVVVPTPIRAARYSRKRLAFRGAALLAGAGAEWFGYDWWTAGRFIESTDDAYVGGDVTVMAPKVRRLHRRDRRHRHQEVHADDLLIRLDDRDYRAALAKADIADGLHGRVGLRREDVFISLVEVRKENWSFGNGLAQYA